MVAASAVSWVVATVLAGPGRGLAIFYGMLGPLVATSGSWVVAETVFKRAPNRLTAAMAGGFGVKMVFFGAYVVVALRVLSLPPVPFVASFTSYFIGLYAIEAMLMRRLFRGGSSA